MLQKELLKKEIAAIGEEISHELGNEFVGSFQKAYPNEPGGYTVGRNIIDAILAQPGCVGLRFYNALNEAGEKTMVYVGIDAEGKDILKRTVVMHNGGLADLDGIMADRLGGLFGGL